MILASSLNEINDSNLLVGNKFRDDAAVYDLGNGEAVISTTDFLCRLSMMLTVDIDKIHLKHNQSIRIR